MEAMELVGSEFKERILFTKSVWLPAREIVLKAVQNRHMVSVGKLNSTGCE